MDTIHMKKKLEIHDNNAVRNIVLRVRLVACWVTLPELFGSLIMTFSFVYVWLFSVQNQLVQVFLQLSCCMLLSASAKSCSSSLRDLSYTPLR